MTWDWLEWVQRPTTDFRWAVYEKAPDGTWRLSGNTHETQSAAIDAFEGTTGRTLWKRLRRNGKVMCRRVLVGLHWTDKESRP